MTMEVKTFLKQLAAKLCITPQAAEQIWKDYHAEKEMTEEQRA
jgi:hypothetical protein